MTAGENCADSRGLRREAIRRFRRFRRLAIATRAAAGSKTSGPPEAFGRTRRNAVPHKPFSEENEGLWGHRCFYEWRRRSRRRADRSLRNRCNLRIVLDSAQQLAIVARFLEAPVEGEGVWRMIL